MDVSPRPSPRFATKDQHRHSDLPGVWTRSISPDRSRCSRLPDTKVHIIGTRKGPFRELRRADCHSRDDAVRGAAARSLLVPGGAGQQALMNDTNGAAFIRRHAAAGKPIFSVCTGALICGAAGILKGRSATTHWTAFDLLPYFGAIPVE